jgi:hypothetical protein
MTAHEDQPKLPLPHESLPKDLPKEIPAHVTPTQQAHQMPQQNEYEVRTLLSWHAPGRPFRQRGKEYFLNIILIALALIVIAFLFGQYLLMLVIASLVFFNYAINTVVPHDYHYKISTEGISIEDRFFLWQELYDFYFKRKDGIDVLHIRTRAYLPGELLLTLGDMHREHVKSVLLPYLPFREIVPPTSLEKAGEWLARTFPLEKTQSHAQK